MDHNKRSTYINLPKNMAKNKAISAKETKPLEEADNEPVDFPIIKQSDLPIALPRYTGVLARSAGDGVGMDDLDMLQRDLEALLSKSSLRQRSLTSELECLDMDDEKKEKRGKSYNKQSVKRKKIEDKLKHRNIGRILKSKPTSTTGYIPETRPEKPKVVIPRHDASDRFWLSIEPYCQEVSKDNVCFLDDLIKECSQKVDIQIPEIGEHYAAEWAENSIQMEQTNGNAKSMKKNQNNNDTKKQGLANNNSIDTFPSPLSQRLIDALIEENSSNLPSGFDKLKSNDFGIKMNNSGRGGGQCIDRRLREYLHNLGVFQLEDLPKSYPGDDELLVEIKNLEVELANINKHNMFQLNKLRTAVAKDMRKREVSSALDKIDLEVLNLTGHEPNAQSLLDQQGVLHSELINLTDFSLLGD